MLSASISTNTRRLSARQARQAASAQAASSAQASSHSPITIKDPVASADNAMALYRATPNTLPQTRMTMPEMPDVAGQQAQQMGRAVAQI